MDPEATWIRRMRVRLSEYVPAGGRDSVQGMTDMEQLCAGSGGCGLYSNSAGTCVPPLVSENVLTKVKVIDLSADFRIKDVR